MNVIECSGVTKVYGKNIALNNLSFNILENTITGLIGRNGAGKSTLLKIIGGFTRYTSGNINVFSERPFNNLKVSANMIFVDEHLNVPINLSLGELLKLARRFYTNWDQRLAESLLDYFSLNPVQYHGSLSKGMKSTFNMIMGIAARSPLTIFDEPTSGMDAAVRKDFYRALLMDYINHPRTILLSSHHLNEVEDILENILLIKSGEKCLHIPISDLKEYAIGLSGKSDMINAWTKGKKVLHQKAVGNNQTYVVIKNDLTELSREQAQKVGIVLSPVTSEDLCMYITDKRPGGIDDVFNRG